MIQRRYWFLRLFWPSNRMPRNNGGSWSHSTLILFLPLRLASSMSSLEWMPSLESSTWTFFRWEARDFTQDSLKFPLTDMLTLSLRRDSESQGLSRRSLQLQEMRDSRLRVGSRLKSFGERSVKSLLLELRGSTAHKLLTVLVDTSCLSISGWREDNKILLVSECVSLMPRLES